MIPQIAKERMAHNCGKAIGWFGGAGSVAMLYAATFGIESMESGLVKGGFAVLFIFLFLYINLWLWSLQWGDK